MRVTAEKTRDLIHRYGVRRAMWMLSRTDQYINSYPAALHFDGGRWVETCFNRDGPHNFCYLSVDPVARQVKYWYAAWFPMM